MNNFNDMMKKAQEMQKSCFRLGGVHFFCRIRLSKLVLEKRAPGGGLGCTSDSVLVNPADQQILEPGSHTLVIDFTTNDGLYHVDAYYEIALKLTVPR